MPDRDANAIEWWRSVTPRRVTEAAGWLLAWGWAIVAGGGGFGLILTEGPLPLTHGWFAVFSGISLCPLTAWLLKQCAKIEVSYLARFAAAAFLIAAGRLALKYGVWPIGPVA
jgi:hypothetical protein